MSSYVKNMLDDFPVKLKKSQMAATPIHQDSKSTILLQENWRKRAGKRSRALNVRYFFLMDQVKKGNLRITYCPTNDMTADYMMKPLQGEMFRKFRAEIMGL